MDQLIQYGEVKRGLLGVNIMTLTPDLKAAAGAPPDTQGALVTQVVPGSPADKAGIKINDVVTSVNGHPVRAGGELRNSIGLLRVGDKVEVGLLRDGKPRKVTAVIGAKNDIVPVAGDVHRGLEGATFADADNGAGAVVQSVDPNSPAAEVGLRPNDVITRVNRTPVDGVDDLKAAAESDQQTLLLTIRRGNGQMLLPVR
jgi:serine protease Do/serine protease DegQ